jgi:hypothetical protein
MHLSEIRSCPGILQHLKKSDLAVAFLISTFLPSIL